MSRMDHVSLIRTRSRRLKSCHWTWCPTREIICLQHSPHKIELSRRAPPSAAVYCCRVVDTNGDGLVHVDDIMRNFRSHAHPEVASGSREEEDVRREFLESFSGTLRNYGPSQLDKGAGQLAEDRVGLR